MLRVERLRRPVVGRLDTDHDLTVVVGCLARCVDIERGRILLRTAHPRRGDIHIGEDADRRFLDHRCPKMIDLFGAGCARIDAGGHTRIEEVGVRVQTGRKHSRAVVRPTGVRVRVDVDQPRRHNKVRRVYESFTFGQRNGFRHTGDLPALDGDVCDRVERIGRVDDTPALEDQIIRLRIVHGSPS